MAERIPAWKKLGLKLKFAKNTSELPLAHITSNGVTPCSDVKKRKHLQLTQDFDTGTVASQLSKKQGKVKVTKRSSPPVAVTSTLSSVEVEPIQGIQRDHMVDLATPPSLRKRKSVSFTPETKTTDGEGSKKLYDAWLAQQSTDFDPKTAPEALRHVTSPSINEPTASIELKHKKASYKADIAPRSKSASAPKSETLPHILATLQYLKDFHKAKQTWKFNKSKQNQVLKYALNTIKIPPEYDSALYAYMSSLQSPAARKRVRDEALTVRKEDADIESGNDMTSEGGTDAEDSKESNPKVSEKSDEEGDDNAADEQAAKTTSTGKATTKAKRAAAKAARHAVENPRRENYRRALRRYKRQLKTKEFEREEQEKADDAEWRTRLLKRKRAELLLWAVGDAGGAADEPREIDQTVQLTTTGELYVRPGTVETGVLDGAEGESAAKRQKLNSGAVGVAGKRKRKRKRRTGVPDDDSSSTESSSDSDSVLTSSDPSEESKTETSSSGLESSELTSTDAEEKESESESNSQLTDGSSGSSDGEDDASE